MTRGCILFAVLSGSLALGAHPLAGKTQELDAYTEGRILAETDDWIGALNVWSDGQDALNARGIFDPRIGIAYMSLVTERKATGFYESASEIFLRGFSTTNVAQYRTDLLAEAGRIQPLFEEDSDEWHRCL